MCVQPGCVGMPSAPVIAINFDAFRNSTPSSLLPNMVLQTNQVWTTGRLDATLRLYREETENQFQTKNGGS